MKGCNINSTLKSLYITLQGYILTSLASLVVYPLVGIPLVLTTTLQVGIILTVVAFVSNVVALKVISKFEREKSSAT